VKDGSENPFMKRSAIKDCSGQPELVAALNKVIYTTALQQGHDQKSHKKNRHVFTNRFIYKEDFRLYK
jgi:hypothetical protein